MIAIDLYAGLGGWTDGLLAAGFDVIGFDSERHVYGDQEYPAQLVLQDVRTLHGSQFRGADLIVASPPCQEYSYMAMPWSRAKQIARALRGEDDFPEGWKGSRTIDELNALFDACFRIQREACKAAGRHIPMVVENVKGAQPWVGRARWNYGSYYLWGDVPALMPMASGAKKRNPDRTNPVKNVGGSWFHIAHNTGSGTNRNPVHTPHMTNPAEHLKAPGNKFCDKGFNVAAAERYGSMVEGVSYARSEADKRNHTGVKRKFASAMIAKIPYDLARHIGEVYAS